LAHQVPTNHRADREAQKRSALHFLLSRADGWLLRHVASTLRIGLGHARTTKDLRRGLMKRLGTSSQAAAALSVLTQDMEERLVRAEDWKLADLVGVSTRILTHEHFALGQSWVVTRSYDADVCLFLPCHSVKPYTFTPTIRAALDAIPGNVRVEMVVLSVPGVVPLRFAAMYPFAYYDWNPDDERQATIMAYEQQVEFCVSEFLRRHRMSFRRFVGYFRPNSAEALALERAAHRLGVNVTLVPDAVTVNRFRARNPVSWRFRGLKLPECLADLNLALSMEART
jgi:hypothetical protein